MSDCAMFHTGIGHIFNDMVHSRDCPWQKFSSLWCLCFAPSPQYSLQYCVGRVFGSFQAWQRMQPSHGVRSSSPCWQSICRENKVRVQNFEAPRSISGFFLLHPFLPLSGYGSVVPPLTPTAVAASLGAFFFFCCSPFLKH